MFKNFLKANFPNIDDNMLITSYANLNKEKEDIWIKVGKEKKSIRIKSNNTNIVHKEYIYNFTNYLEQEKVPIKIIDIILNYFFTANIKLKIKKVNKYFIRHEDLLIKLINRFVIGSTDILIHGTVDNFTYITKDEMIKLLLNQKKDSFPNIHFSHLILSPKNYNNEIEKFILQIKWHNLNNDIETIRKKTCN